MKADEIKCRLWEKRNEVIIEINLSQVMQMSLAEME